MIDSRNTSCKQVLLLSQFHMLPAATSNTKNYCSYFIHHSLLAHTHTYTHNHTHCLTLSLSHTHTHTHTGIYTHFLSLSLSLSLSHTRTWMYTQTLSLSHTYTYTHSLSHTHILVYIFNTLTSCFHVLLHAPYLIFTVGITYEHLYFIHFSRTILNTQVFPRYLTTFLLI